MSSFVADDWNYFWSSIKSIWNPEAVGGAGGTAGDFLYNAATGNLTSDQIKSVCGQAYANTLKAGKDPSTAQQAYNECSKVAQQGAGGTNLIWWAVGALAAIVLIESV